MVKANTFIISKQRRELTKVFTKVNGLITSSQVLADKLTTVLVNIMDIGRMAKDMAKVLCPTQTKTCTLVTGPKARKMAKVLILLQQQMRSTLEHS